MACTRAVALFGPDTVAVRVTFVPGRGAPYGWNAPDTMWPWFDRTINSWFGTERNGYRYASLPGS